MDAPITVIGHISASPDEVYSAFLDADSHGAMTGAAAAVGEGGAFTAWDGYIQGQTVEEVPGKKLVQSWRTAHFADSDPNSVLEIHFEGTSKGTQVTFHHRDLPDGQAADYEQGWVEHYLEPMEVWFKNR
jgi:activator of HSP90 ATPase